MPPYFSVQLEFDRSDGADLVRRVHEGFAAAGAPFRGVFAWGCAPDLPQDAIVTWNQARLDRGFRLGLSQHVSKDYRQVLLDLPPFTEARVFLSLAGSGVSFCLIVPESEVDDAGAAALERVARSMWSSVRPRSIQTFGETGAAPRHEALLRGAAPAAARFAFLDSRYPASRPEGNEGA